jgi:hypothetical protein
MATNPVDIINAALPAEVRQAHIRERIVNLAANGYALTLDLGVDISDEQREATEAQIAVISAEIERLQSLLD